MTTRMAVVRAVRAKGVSRSTGWGRATGGLSDAATSAPDNMIVQRRSADKRQKMARSG